MSRRPLAVAAAVLFVAAGTVAVARTAGEAAPRTGRLERVDPALGALALPGAALRAESTGPSFAMAPYTGLGTWVDVYDWSHRYTGGRPAVVPADVDRMAEAGMQTLFLQVSTASSPTAVLEPDLVSAFVDRAHERGMAVVAWYVPTLVDPAADLGRLLAAASLDVDGLAVDIEARDVADLDERNRRLVRLSADLRDRLPDQVLGAIVLEPVLLDRVNPAYWPRFPWAGIAPSYDVWLPMAYWSNRRADSGWRDGRHYLNTNVDGIRHHVGPDAVVHGIGGVGDRVTPEGVAGMVLALADRGCIGGSLYDWRTTGPELLPLLRELAAR